MSSTQEGTTLILASIAVCLMIYAMNQQYKKGDTSVRIVNALSSAKETLGASRFFKGRFGKKNRKGTASELKMKRLMKKELGVKKARVDESIDCSNLSPSDPNWARCAQGAGVGRVRTNKAGQQVTSTLLDFAKDSTRHQGLGSGVKRLSDDFVNDQFDQGLGAGAKGMKISNNLQNNAFFSEGTENPGSLVTSGISSEGAAAFPFSRRSDEGAEARQNSPPQTGPVPGTEPVGMGMNFAAFARKAKSEFKGDGSRGSARQDVMPKQVGADFNPFVQEKQVGNPFVKSTEKLGAGLSLSEAFEQKNVGSGLPIKDAFKTQSLGSAVSPISEVGASPEDISAATAVLKEVNIVQSTTGGQLDFGIRP